MEFSLPFEQGRLTTAAAVEHTNNVADTARRTLFGVRDAELSRQAYSLTHSLADLDVYRTELAGVKQNLAALQDLTRDIPVQQERLSRLRDLMAAQDQADPARAGNDPLPIREARSTISAVIELERRGLQQDITDAGNAERRRTIVFTILSVIPLVILALCAFGLSMIPIASKTIERRAAERDRLLNIMDLAAVIVRDMDGTILFWSQGCDRMFGWTAAEAVGQLSHVLLRTVYPNSRAEMEATLLHTGEWTSELHHTTRAGVDVAVVARKILRREADGRALVLEILTDATALRQSEEALREPGDLRSVVETAAEASSSPAPTARSPRSTSAACACLGFDSETAVIGRTWAC